MTTDYKDTIQLPRTAFSMKAGLPKLEPELLARWQDIDLWRQLRSAAKGKPKFILHDGPPYANGHLHIGHALNKILKDVINRSQQMLGKDANYVPGWDCHGLPIEWKIEEQYREAGKDKDAVPIVEFRKECRDFAAHWIEVQREEFERLGVLGDWDDPYTTMAYAAEAQIAREIGAFLLNGSLYRGAKPVLWSVVEKTALAEAEVEYQDVTSPTIWVKFPVVRYSEVFESTELEILEKIHSGLSKADLSDNDADPSERKLGYIRKTLEGASVVIWTTTPWTIPGNRAIAYADQQTEETVYGLYIVINPPEEGGAKKGDKLILARGLVDQVKQSASGLELMPLRELSPDELEQIVCAHPLRGQGYDFDVRMYPADFVTMEQGTGFVHIAPGHGADDFVLGAAHGIEVPATVGEDGVFYDHVPLFAGKTVYTEDGKPGDITGAVIQALIDAGGLLAKGRLRHSYPHSWRSKAPLIFRNTAQWFISMESDGLRDKALAEIDKTAFYPPQSRNRLYAMIESRPDWCISRQRAWGVPIPVFFDKRTGEPLRDPNVVDRIVAAFEAEGADAWFASEPSRFLGNDYNPDDYEQVRDVVDVWFDSGSTHAFVLEQRPDLAWPASLYLEGSDQHRGWFHSSLLESCGTRGRAPYEGVLTHGFVMAEDGRKMSKSLGNIVAPQEVVEQYGAETLRLWVVASDYSEDLKIGPEIIKHQVDAYRRLRNTLRYLLGNLNGFESASPVAPDDMPELERWVLHRLWEMDRNMRECCERYDFNAVFRHLHDFCALDLSAFYFDIRKDALYCDGLDSARRRAAQTVLAALFDCLTAWLAPILCFTAEEAWLARHPDAEGSVHLRQFPEIPDDWRADALAERWEKVRAVRRMILGALEIERAEKRIGSSLLAAPEVYLSDDYVAALEGLDLADIAITSNVSVIAGAPPTAAFTLPDVPGVGVVPKLAGGEKCARCWRVLPDVGRQPDVPEACGRCADAVRSYRPAAE